MSEHDEMEQWEAPEAPKAKTTSEPDCVSKRDAKLLDPLTVPKGPESSRANLVPILVCVVVVTLFVVVFVYDSASAATEEALNDDVVSAVQAADRVLGDYEAGEVPPGGVGASRSGPGGGSHAGSSSGLAGASATAGARVEEHADRSTKSAPGFPPPPPPPNLSAELQPPGSIARAEQARGSGSSAGQGAGGEGGTGIPNASGQLDPYQEEFGRMRMRMFQEALGGKTTVASAENPSRTAPAGHVSLAGVAASLPPGGGYAEKLAALQGAGLLPSSVGDPSEAQGRSKQAGYAAFDAKRGDDRWTLGNSLEAPQSRYLLRAGAVIPAVLQTGVVSDLPGQITAIVSQDVRDTATGRFLLIPQGSRLVGAYQSEVSQGQERLLVAWQRITWPDGKVLDIGAMPGTDSAGAAGLEDQVNTHFWDKFASALFMSGVTGGIGLSQGQFGGANGTQTVGGVMAQALGQQLAQLTEAMIQQQMNRAPTLEIRPGYRLNVSVTKDLIFAGPYKAFDYDRTIRTAGQTYRQESAP